VVGVALSDYLAGSHDDRLAAFIQMGIRPIGMIIARAGDSLVVNTPSGQKTVVLTADTQTKDDRGLFGLETQQMGAVVLIPGLKVKVDGVADEKGRVVAKTITVDGDDLETAEMIQSGLHPTAQQVEEGRTVLTKR
jgi:endonuclease YncB( thermonuclease family)